MQYISKPIKWLSKQLTGGKLHPVAGPKRRFIPRLEQLEQREVLSAVNYGSVMLPHVAVQSSSYGSEASDSALHSVVGQSSAGASSGSGANAGYQVANFNGSGVWRYSSSTGWQQLTGANASALSIDAAGDVVGEFPGYGVCEYKTGAGWQQLTSANASALSMDAAGNVVGEFPGYGVLQYKAGSGWQQLTGADAALLSVDAAGDVVAEFPGYGVCEYKTGAGWQQLTGANASLMAVNSVGDVVGDFAGYGLYEYKVGAGWQHITGADVSQLSIDAAGDVFGEFPGYGVCEYKAGAGWQQLTGADAAALAVDAAGNVVGDFPGYGVLQYTAGSGWKQLTGADASLVAVGGAIGPVGPVSVTTDHPAANSSYSVVNGSLFGPNGPTYLDVQQGAVGDCWLMASLAEVAARYPAEIQSMITTDGAAVENGTSVNLYTVRLYNNAGVAEYYTVDNELPSGGTYYDHPANGVLWVALVEKAYAVANGAGMVTTGNVGSDSYAALEGGYAEWALQAITGKSASDFSINPTNIAAAWNAGKLIVLGSSSTATSTYIVGDSNGTHAYAVVGYNPSSSQPYQVYNPWGTDSSGWAPGTYNGHQVFGLFNANATFLSQNFADQSIGSGAASGMDDFKKVMGEVSDSSCAYSSAPIASSHNGHAESQSNAYAAFVSTDVAGMESKVSDEIANPWKTTFGLSSNRSHFVSSK